MTASALDVLDNVYGVLKSTKSLALIFDSGWHAEVKARVEAGGGTSRKDLGESQIYGLWNPLRGQAWYDKMHDEVEAKLKSGAEVTMEEALILGFLPDQARVWLEELDARLTDFRSIPFKKDIIEVKWKELLSVRDTIAFGPRAFEASVLGFFHNKGVLRDVEVPSDNGRGTVDGLIELDGRSMLAEVTLMMRELIPKTEGTGWLDVSALLGAVKEKVMKKAGAGQQLGEVRNRPALLVIGRNPWGADEIASKWAIESLYKAKDAAVLSGVVVSDSWVFQEAHLHPNGAATVPFTKHEKEVLQEWFSEIDGD